MGILDDIKNAAQGHEAEIAAGIDKLADIVDEKTGGQYAQQVDQAQEFLKDQVAAPETPHA